jgi:hypothetical protein
MLWVLCRPTYSMGGFHRNLTGIRSVSDRYFIGILSVWVVSLCFIGMSLVFNRYSIGVNHARVSCGNRVTWKVRKINKTMIPLCSPFFFWGHGSEHRHC